MTRAHLNGQSTDERILLALKRGPQTITTLAGCLQLRPASVSYAMKRLIHETEREPAPENPRYARYRLSAIGRQRVALMEWRRKTNS